MKSLKNPRSRKEDFKTDSHGRMIIEEDSDAVADDLSDQFKVKAPSSVCLKVTSLPAWFSGCVPRNWTGERRRGKGVTRTKEEWTRVLMALEGVVFTEPTQRRKTSRSMG